MKFSSFFFYMEVHIFLENIFTLRLCRAETDLRKNPETDVTSQQCFKKSDRKFTDFASSSLRETYQ